MDLLDSSNPYCANSRLKMCMRYAWSNHNKLPCLILHLCLPLPVLHGRCSKGIKVLMEV